MADKPLSDMSLDELKAERDKWDEEVAHATSWGAALSAASEFRNDCDREIARRKGVKWTQQQAIDLCRKIETLAPKFGCHVALTGGTLYRDGERKDADILFYRIRQVKEIDVSGLMAALSKLDIVPATDHGWCYKAHYEGRAIDFFFPEREGVEYPGARA